MLQLRYAQTTGIITFPEQQMNRKFNTELKKAAI